jgi:hypothetical protein
LAVFGSKTVWLEYLVEYDPGVPTVGLRFDGHFRRHNRGAENQPQTLGLEIRKGVCKWAAGVLGV